MGGGANGATPKEPRARVLVCAWKETKLSKSAIARRGKTAEVPEPSKSAILITIEQLMARWSLDDRVPPSGGESPGRRYLRSLRERGIFPGVKMFGRKTVLYRMSDVLKVEAGEWPGLMPTGARPRWDGTITEAQRVARRENAKKATAARKQSAARRREVTPKPSKDGAKSRKATSPSR